MPELSRRAVADEMMDTTWQPVASLEAALRFLARTNRWFGGYTPLLRRFERWSRHWDPGRPVQILDVGVGAADIPLTLVTWARRRGLQVRVTAMEMVAAIADIARARTVGVPEIRVINGDARAFLFGDLAGADAAGAMLPGRFDYVVACLFLHHVVPEETVAVLERLARLAVRGVIVSDLRRSWPGLVAVTAASTILGNAVVRHDAPLSVRRAFTVAELRDIALQANLSWLRARNERWFRVSLAGERPRAA